MTDFPLGKEETEKRYIYLLDSIARIQDHTLERDAKWASVFDNLRRIVLDLGMAISFTEE